MVPAPDGPTPAGLLEAWVVNAETSVLVLSFGDWLSPHLAPVLVLVIILAVLGTMVLFLVGLYGYLQRQTTTYLVLTIVLGALVARSVVGMGTVLGLVPMTAHHLIEHGFDVLIATLLLSLIVRHGPAGGGTNSDSE
ncbi:hypothetical protein [Natronorubrum sp. A-ect3]|uniref:DUF7471 family protein n=1 Tax=Natronorubrum sp. A-ect3 TaxID=3242698 RepID=UPI00359D9CB5